MAPRDPRSPSGPHGARSKKEYMESNIVMKTVSAKSRRKTMVISSKLPLRWERERS